MKHRLPLVFSFVALLSACTSFNSTNADKRNYAVDTYYPGLNEIRVAESRARRYWEKNANRLSPEPRYLLVAASTLLAAELSAEFSIKLDHVETSGGYFTQGISSSSRLGLQGFLLFDTKTGQAAAQQGYILVDTPSRNQVVQVGQYTARYIGSGG
ncbi:MAG TPA: hypothetical protein VE860_01930 [Chthoniobacterales bacterium]|nr:hypothetical protein [Chthoniobacterales bacterium]